MHNDVQIDPELAHFFDKGSEEQMPAEFLEHIQEAFHLHDKLRLPVELPKSNVPVIGPLLQWVRRQFHQLVIYYVNRVSHQQMQFNFHMIKAVYVLGQMSVKQDLADNDSAENDKAA